MSRCDSDTSDTVAIIKLEELIRRLGDDGRDNSAIGQFFEVGEWLIAFEGVENAFSNIPLDNETRDKLLWLRGYFGD